MWDVVHYVVDVMSLSKERVRRFVEDWQKHVKYSLPDTVKQEVLVEGKVGDYRYVLLIKGTLLGLLVALKLIDLGEKHGVHVSVYKTDSILVDEDYIDRVMRKRIEKIPPHLLYEVRKCLIERRLPRGKRRREIIEAMKV